MARIIKSEKLGYYYTNVRPYVDCIGVSELNGTYNLEGEDAYSESNKIGTFEGHPGSITESEELNFGFTFSEGVISIEGIETYVVKNGFIFPFENNFSTINDSIKEFDFLKNQIIPECTPIVVDIDTNNKLGFENNFDKKLLCGIFSGAPGKYIMEKNQNGTESSNRIYGFDYANGTILLNFTNISEYNPYLKQIFKFNNFSYWLKDGVVSEICKKSYK